MTDKIKIVLASRSPRRRELLKQICEDFEIITAEVDEDLPFGIDPRRGVELLAVRKGAAVISSVGESCAVVSSDTLVELDGIPLGKPTDEADARRMLRTLSGRAHRVHTGVAVHFDGKVYSGVDTTTVIFRELNDEEIDAYVASGEPMDKAGAYGIQGLGGRLVSSYSGRFDTVVGLSVDLTRRLLSRALGRDI